MPKSIDLENPFPKYCTKCKSSDYVNVIGDNSKTELFCYAIGYPCEQIKKCTNINYAPIYHEAHPEL